MSAFKVEANMTDEQLEEQVQLAVKALHRAGLPFTEERIRDDVFKRRAELQAFNRKEDERINERVKEQYPQLAPLMRRKRTEEPFVDPSTRREALKFEITHEPRDQSSPTLVQEALHTLVAAIAAQHQSLHHLKYTHTEDDGAITFVCVCDAGFSERQNWNHHISVTLMEVLG